MGEGIKNKERKKKKSKTSPKVQGGGDNLFDALKSLMYFIFVCFLPEISWVWLDLWLKWSESDISAWKIFI